MVLSKVGAWTTSVVKNDNVAAALVLGESIRRTRTGFYLTAITSLNVSPENRAKLHQSFDMVFLIDESCAPGVNFKEQQDDAVAKVYAFMLMLFDKCVFLPANSLFLENADNLFVSTSSKFQARATNTDGSLDLSFFAVEPDKEVYNQVWKSVGYNGKCITNEYLGLWLKNQEAVLKSGTLPQGTIADFSVARGKLLSDKTHASVIHFVNPKSVYGLGVDELRSLVNSKTGQHEKLITEKWLELFSNTTQTIPRSNIIAGLGLKRENVYKNEPIAIVGMSCRMPGANSVEEFWKLLYAGQEGIAEPPAFRWRKEHCLKVTQQDRKLQAGFLSTPVDEFDAKFFGVSPKEAAYMDPQVRLLHEVVWESLEDAGINPLALYGSHTGIYTGSWMNDYKDLVTHSPDKDFFRSYMGNSIGAAAARLSFLLGLTGPSIATESGCSSAIVALDMAVKGLRNGETNLALAGGVNLILHPFSVGMLEYVIAPNGRCKTFDEKADGFGRAEGCGVFVLKRMSDALRDRDNIWALIRGSAVSQEGISRSLGTPTVHCEALAMQLALEDAGVAPERVSFVETHGTGTSVGDPMEVAAIAKAYSTPARKEPLIIGSVKTNVGHTESCSGITGVLKSVLSLQNELIPLHKNFDTLNPEICLDNIPARIPIEPIPWPKVQGNPRVCGVSSFGITGTDGHVIIQEAPDYQLPKFTLSMERPMHIIKISGKSQEALDDLLQQYENRFAELAPAAEKGNDSQFNFANAAHSSNVGRASFGQRVFFLAKDFEDAVGKLKDKKFVQGEPKDGENQQLCFLFTGQGSQYQGMAKMLYETSPVFQIHFDACDRTLQEMYNLSIKQVLWESDPNSKELSRTIYSQTSIFCVEYCLFKLWQSWGIKPNYVLGHSLGEFCAAVAAEILSFEDALKLVAERSRLIDNLPRGSMLVIKASKKDVDKYLASGKVDLDYAAVNSPDQTVVAGDTKTVESFLEYLKGHGVKAIILEATHAFHSRHMDPMLQKYRKIADSINYKAGNPNIQYISGMEGKIIENPSEIDSNYWVRHTREKVSFTEACAALKENGCSDFLEIGPQPVLNTFVMLNNEGVSMNCLPSLRKNTNDWETILTSLGKLYLAGYNVDWKGYDEPYTRQKISLPFHPFHRKSFWIECSSDYSNIIHPLVGYPVKNASTLNIFQNDILIKTVPYLKDHCIGTRFVFPGAGFTEMCLSAAYCVANGLSEELEQPTRPIKLENVRIEAPLELKEGRSCRTQVLVDLPEADQTQDTGFRVRIYHQNTNDNEEYGKWVLHATSTFAPVASTKECLKLWNPARIQQILAESQATLPDQFYTQADQLGLKFGETFRSIREYWPTQRKTEKGEASPEVVAKLTLPAESNKYLLHPTLIDAMFQTSLISKLKSDEAKLNVPVGIGQLTLISGMEPAPEQDFVYLHSWQEEETGVFCAFLCTPQLTPLAYIENVTTIETNVKTIEGILEQQSTPLPSAWEEAWKQIPSPLATAVKMDQDLDQICSSIEVDPTSEENIMLFNKTSRLLCLYIVNVLQELGWNPVLGQQITDIVQFCKQLQIDPAFRQLVRFYFFVLERDAGFVSLDENTQVWTVQELPPRGRLLHQEIQQLSSFLKGTKDRTVIMIYERVAQNLVKVLTGQESALQLLFPKDPELQQYSAETYYLNQPGRPYAVNMIDRAIRAIFNSLRKHIDANHDKVFRVLEVGAGTGSLSIEMLRHLKEEKGNLFEYYYTDISQSFFVKAEKKFEEFKENLKFVSFNVEESPLSQGVPVEYFDMVVGSDVLHATRDLVETFTHLRQTLQPRGVLFITDTVKESLAITFVFGLLEGYWRYQDFGWRPHHCCVKPPVWKQLLNRSGFETVHVFSVYQDELGIITAGPRKDVRVELLDVPREREQETPKEWLVFAERERFEVMARIANMLDVSGYKVEVIMKQEGIKIGEKERSLLKPSVHWGYAGNVEEFEKRVGTGNVHGLLYAWGLNVGNREEESVTRPYIYIAKALVAMDNGPLLYVVTQGVHPVVEDTLCVNPTGAVLYGMSKSLKNEHPTAFVRCVDLERDCDEEKVTKQLLYELAMNRGGKEGLRLQVAYRGMLRYEPRLVKGLVQTGKDDLKLPPSSERYQLKLPKTRLIQDLEFIPLEEEETLGEGEIEVKVKAFALNFRDIFSILKPIKEFDNINMVGLDFAGVVTKAGEKSRWQVGERVFGVQFKESQLPSHVVIDSEAVLRVPKEMTSWEAATLPAVFLTAYYCLVNSGKMTNEDTVLIHTGSGGVGLAAIQVARHFGARIITTAGNKRKRTFLRNLGIEHVFHSRDTSYEQEILRVTNGKGVTLVLNSITGPGIKEATLRATAKNGRWIEMSKMSVWSPEEVKALRPDVNYEIVDLTKVDRATNLEVIKKMERLLESKWLKPIPFVKFDALALRQALYYFQKAKHIGKVIVTMPEVSMEQGKFIQRIPLFSPESTYLITGGLGGIGFEVCKWMLERGAMDIVLTGRNPPKPEIEKEIERLNREGYNVMVKLGDVGNFKDCEETINWIKTKGKTLRGVMHCAGVLKDRVYSNQTWENFEETFRPKVQGTWNLHELTREFPLEYFLMFSSLTALLGTPGQPNHSAANCFEDAFIHYRHCLGLPGTTVNWGAWAQVGVAKDINTGSLNPISVERMLNGLEVTLRVQKTQVSFAEFESFRNLGLMCPMLKGYLDARLWKQYEKGLNLNQSVNPEQFWKEMDAVATKEEKMEVMSKHVKTILRQALRMEPDEPISEDEDLKTLGVDSLMTIELKNSMQGLMGTRVTLKTSELKNCTTIRLLANAIVSKIMDGDAGEEQVPLEPLPENEFLQLLQQDLVLPEDIKVTPEAQAARVPITKVRTVLVTGATGNFGAYIIAQLCRAYEHVERIVCLSRDEPNLAREKLKVVLQSMKGVDMAKLECVRGHIVKPKLGLESDEQYNELCENVDAVIHLAAKNHHAEHLRNVENGLTDSRSVNIVGFVNVLRFACVAKVKHLYYPSPLLCGLQDEHMEKNLSDCWPGTEVLHYILRLKLPALQSSKWICEVLMNQAIERGLSCKVFRLPAFGGERETGKVEMVGNFILLRYLSFLRVGAMPDTPMPAQMLPVDTCAELTLRLFFDERTQNEIFNVVHPHPQVEPEFARVAEEEFGKKLELLEQNEFIQRLTEKGKEMEGLGNMQRDQSLVKSLYMHAAPFAQVYFDNAETFFENEKTSKWIDKYGEDFLPSMEYVRKALKYLKGAGLLDKVGM